MSDHTTSLAVVLGAVTLGARVIERHFTDNQAAHGPDHAFSMGPEGWRRMVGSVRELEAALGNPGKVVCPNETEARIVQRRAMWNGRPLRPCPPDREGELNG